MSMVKNRKAHDVLVYEGCCNEQHRLPESLNIRNAICYIQEAEVHDQCQSHGPLLWTLKKCLFCGPRSTSAVFWAFWHSLGEKYHPLHLCFILTGLWCPCVPGSVSKWPV